jgi:hypothetical protein
MLSTNARLLVDIGGSRSRGASGGKERSPVGLAGAFRNRPRLLDLNALLIIAHISQLLQVAEMELVLDSLSVILLGLATLLALVHLVLLRKPDPSVHPLLLGRQSELSKVGSTAVPASMPAAH